MVGQPLTYFLGRDLGGLVRGLEPREHHYREVALKVLAGGCRRYARRIYVESVQLMKSSGHSLRYYFLYCHYAVTVIQ